MNRVSRWIAVAAAGCALAGAQAAGTVGNTLPADFPVIIDASLFQPIIGFGAAGPVNRVPVVLVHGNNDTPFPTACNPFGKIQALAQYLADNGYATSELWGLGYQGDQCDLLSDQTRRSSAAHTSTTNVPDLKAFVAAVQAYTGRQQVDIVAHSLGVTVVREWLRQNPSARGTLRRFVAIDGPNHGIINCSPDPANYWQLPANGGFTPDSAVCQELGSPQTPFLKTLNRFESRDQRQTLVIRNTDASFVYFPVQDGFIAPVPAQDVYGHPTDFSLSARLQGAQELGLAGQGVHDAILGTGHLGILNSPDTWAATLKFLTARRPGTD